MKAWKLPVVAASVVLALALSANTARAQIPLGIVIEETPAGVEVVEVVKDGIADRCMPRLRPGARLVTVNGDPIKSAEQFQQIVNSSTYVKFEFVDPTGERRWARAWSGKRVPLNLGP